jgi:hypothetical protein
MAPRIIPHFNRRSRRSGGFAALAKNDKKGAELARPKLFDDVVACKLIENADQRLACYDEKVSALDAAQKNEEIILTDKAAVKEAQHGLFEFEIPKLKIFDNGGDDVEQIEAVVKSVTANRVRVQKRAFALPPWAAIWSPLMMGPRSA